MSELKRNYIAGAWTEGVHAEDNINPSDTTDIIGQYAHADAAQTEQAIEAAYRASAGWANACISEKMQDRKLQRDRPLQLVVLSLIDDAHAALADLLHHPVVPDHRLRPLSDHILLIR